MRKILATTVLVLALAGCASDNRGSTGAAIPAPGGSGTTTGPSIGGPATSPASSSPPTGSSVTPTVKALVAACPTDFNFVQPNGPSAKVLPAGVQVSSVLRCSVTSTGAARTLVVERSSSDPAALLTALRAPSGLKIKGVCPMYRVAVPYFGLIEPTGAVLVPKVPTTSCGQAQPDVLAALAHLKYTVVSRTPVK